MAVRIRLRQVGGKHKRSFWVVVTDSRAKRNGKFLEKLGIYAPHSDPPQFKINKERLKYWLKVGALPTEVVKELIS